MLSEGRHFGGGGGERLASLKHIKFKYRGRRKSIQYI